MQKCFKTTIHKYERTKFLWEKYEYNYHKLSYTGEVKTFFLYFPP